MKSEFTWASHRPIWPTGEFVCVLHKVEGRDLSELGVSLLDSISVWVGAKHTSQHLASAPFKPVPQECRQDTSGEALDPTTALFHQCQTRFPADLPRMWTLLQDTQPEPAPGSQKRESPRSPSSGVFPVDGQRVYRLARIPALELQVQNYLRSRSKR